MKAGWSFERGVATADGVVPIKCLFQVEEDGGAGRAALEMVIPEASALEMIEQLKKVASPLTVGLNGNGSN